jgi:membrane protein implicated in regulation of membrane protease activity
MCHLILLLPVFALPIFWFFPFSTALPIYLIISGISAFLYFLIFKAMMIKPRVGKEAMLGQKVEVIEDIAPEGKIKYDAEIWNAMTDGKNFSVGEKVIIHGFWGMTVLVREIPVEKPRKQKRSINHIKCGTHPHRNYAASPTHR